MSKTAMVANAHLIMVASGFLPGRITGTLLPTGFIGDVRLGITGPAGNFQFSFTRPGPNLVDTNQHQ